MEQDYNIKHWTEPCRKVDCRKNSCKCGIEKVFIPAAMGDDSEGSPIAPANGAYCNALVVYEANGHKYIYSKEGIPTLITSGGGGDYDEIIKEIQDDLAETENDLAQEVLDRVAGDNTLQGEIDAIKNSPDVVDIVDTYADLQAYDTSHLGDKDIIRVLTDETHDGASSYYRWDKQTETWTYIGSIQTVANTIFYANLSETGNTRHIYKNSDMTGTVSVQELLDANEEGQVILRMSSAQTPENFNDAYLQNTYVGVSDYQFLFLDNRNYYEYDATTTADTTYYYSKSTIQLEMSAGTNITITGNTISATDTTYSNFVGTDGQTAGTAGLVPAPATTDAGKFLKADGTWDTAGGGSGPTVVQTTGTSTTDVMSQNATTSMIFADPATMNNVKIGANTFTPVGSNAIEIGKESKAKGSNTVAIGPEATADSFASYGVAIGADTMVYGSNAIAIGYTAGTNGEKAVALGRGAHANHSFSVALGAGAATSVAGEINVGTGSTYPTNGYNSSNYRLLSGLYDAQSDHDAVTLGQLNGRVKQNAGAPTTSTVGTVGQLLEDTTNGKLYQCTAIDTTDLQNPSYTWTEVGAGGGGGPAVVQTTGTSTTDVMSQDAVTKMINPDITNYPNRVIINSGTIASNTGLVINGEITDAQSHNSIAINAGSTTKATIGSTGYAGESIAIGPSASVAKGYSSIAIGSNAYVATSNAYLSGIAVGMGSYCSGNESLAIGDSARTNSQNDIALGKSSNTLGTYSTAIGSNARARSERSVAIGAGATVENNPAMAYSVALGANAVTTRAGEVNVGTGVSTHGYNSSAYRVIGGVHDGQEAHDAVTVNQVNSVIDAINTALSTNIPHIGA